MLSRASAICNGSKHCGRDRGNFRHAPGSEIDIPPISYGGPGGYGYSRYGGLPGLMVEHNQARFLVDDCLRYVLWAFEHSYPQHFAGVSLDPTDARGPSP
jgi:hypothetical protein